MKRSVLAVACIVGSLLVGNAQHAHAKQPRKLVKKELSAADKETQFLTSLMQKMTLAEKIGQISQYVGGSLLTGP